jgi:hypothetical protein
MCSVVLLARQDPKVPKEPDASPEDGMPMEKMRISGKTGLAIRMEVEVELIV